MKQTPALLRKTIATSVVRKCARATGLWFALALLLADAYPQSILLKDIVKREAFGYNEYSSLTSGDGRVYFVGHLSELWTSSADDPTDLIMLKRFSTISNLTLVGRTLYFVANDGTLGVELWRSNGTRESTVIVKDIRAGTAGSAPSMLTNLRGTLYFVANDGIHGREVWKSNGSPRGTVLVRDIMPRAGNSNPSSLTAVGPALFFAANDGRHGVELWRTDGTPQGTLMVKDIQPGTGINSTPSDLTNVYGTLFFTAIGTTTGRELWKSDGTSDGTVLVKDIAPGTAHSRISNGTGVYRTFFFTATDGIHGQELWKSNGTEEGTVMVEDMTPGPEGSQGEDLFEFKMGNFTNIYGTLFFTAYQKDRYYIWKSNGTTSETIPIVPLSGSGFGARPEFTFLKGRVYYLIADNNQTTFMSMDTDGSDHRPIYAFEEGESYDPYDTDFTLVGEGFFLLGRPDALSGHKVLVSDGTTQGTKILGDISIQTEGGELRAFTPLNGKLYFLADDDFRQSRKLYVTDGSPEGTQHVLSFPEEIGYLQLLGNTLYAASNRSFAIYRVDLERGKSVPLLENHELRPVQVLKTADDNLFFASWDGQLWKSDGTSGGTTMLGDFRYVRAVYPLPQNVFFTVTTDNAALELWSTDGTVAGTRRIKILRNTAGGDTGYDQFAFMRNTLYFFADDGAHGIELWRSDGTSAGTYMIQDLNTRDSDTPNPQDILTLTVFRDQLYFSALTDDGNWALFKSDGSADGTKRVRDLDMVVQSIMLGEKMLLLTSGVVEGQLKAGLFITDGSAEGTERLAVIYEWIGRSSHVVVDGVVYFSVREGGDLWRTDGTECGTFPVAPQPRGASPISAVNATLIFGSYDERAGTEPHALNTKMLHEIPCDQTMASASATQDATFSGYPNPFSNDFAFRVAGSEGETTRVQVFTLYGEPVEDTGELGPGTEQRLGQSWRKGIYVLQVMRGPVVGRYRVVKE